MRHFYSALYGSSTIKLKFQYLLSKLRLSRYIFSVVASSIEPLSAWICSVSMSFIHILLLYFYGWGRVGLIHISLIFLYFLHIFMFFNFATCRLSVIEENLDSKMLNELSYRGAYYVFSSLSSKLIQRCTPCSTRSSTGDKWQSQRQICSPVIYTIQALWRETGM